MGARVGYYEFKKEEQVPIKGPQDRYVQVGSIRTRFWRLGDEGTAVVLIHGISGSVESWVCNVHALAEHHRVYALDLAGHGRSDKPAAAYSIPFFVQFLRDFLQTQDVDRASLVGNSMGGTIALQFALLFPDKVEKLVVVSSVGLGKEVSHLARLAALPFVGEWLARPSRRGAARVLNAMFLDPALVTDERIERRQEYSALPGAQAAYLSILRCVFTVGGQAPQTWRPVVENLSHITAPTLVVWGQQDRLLPVAHAQVANDRMPNVRLHIFDRCGHMAQVERSAEFNELVLEFLAG